MNSCIIVDRILCAWIQYVEVHFWCDNLMECYTNNVPFENDGPIATKKKKRRCHCWWNSNGQSRHRRHVTVIKHKQVPFLLFFALPTFFFPFATMHIIHTLPPLYQIIIHTFMPNTTDCKCSSQALSAFWYTNYISANGTCQLWSLSLLFACGRRQYGLMTRCTHSREIFFVVALLVGSMLSFYIFLRANFLFFRMNSLFIYYRICFFRHMTFKCDVIIIYIHNDAIYERLYNTRIFSRFT